MKPSRLLIIACTALTLAALNAPLTLAHEGDDHSATAIPDTADGILKEIQKHHAEIASAVSAKNLKDVHHHAETMTALAKALPEKVTEDKKARVQGSANNLTKLVDTLHHAADEGDLPRAGIELKKLEGVVKALEQQLK